MRIVVVPQGVQPGLIIESVIDVPSKRTFSGS